MLMAVLQTAGSVNSDSHLHSFASPAYGSSPSSWCSCARVCLVSLLPALFYSALRLSPPCASLCKHLCFSALCILFLPGSLCVPAMGTGLSKKHSDSSFRNLLAVSERLWGPLLFYTISPVRNYQLKKFYIYVYLFLNCFLLIDDCLWNCSS